MLTGHGELAPTRSVTRDSVEFGDPSESGCLRLGSVAVAENH